MALVMLPCDLPWWETVKGHLKKILILKNIEELIEGMQKIYELCSISLDPDEDSVNPEQFVCLKNFLENDLSKEERNKFLNKTLPSIITRALKLKDFKPIRGHYFSLQQQPDSTELDYNFISSLIANSFFSTFPKRTDKSHPTLKDFNFSCFFKHLDTSMQRSKLKSLFYYFDWLDDHENLTGNIRIIRQVMTGKEWLTIEDWLECSLPLCSVQIKHEGKLERSEPNALKICFANSKIGGNVLENGFSQESINLITYPELLPILLNIEALEDNEVLTIESVRHFTRISDSKGKVNLEKLDNPYKTTVCCMDADDYSRIGVGQYEEDNILRELNKCLLAFQQKQINSDLCYNSKQESTTVHRHRRLSPIRETYAFKTSSNIPLITQQSCSTIMSDKSSSPPINNNNLMVNNNTQKQNSRNSESFVHNRRGRFIVLGSSGECLPVNRLLDDTRSIYGSCDSSDDEFLSAQESLEDESGDEGYRKQKLASHEKRNIFAQRLKDVQTSSSTTSTSEESSSLEIADCEDYVKKTKIRREGSTGFVLKEESIDEDLLQGTWHKKSSLADKISKKHNTTTKKEPQKSSNNSITTEYSSDLEEVFEQFSKWLENPILETENGMKRELRGREMAVVQFAGSILKRTLSESFAGVIVPLTEENETIPKADYSNSEKKNKLILNAKSLSLELAKQKHKLASQLISQMAQISSNGLKPVATGNWGCGSSKKGDSQLKVIIQWLAASVAGVPFMIYYTAGNQQLVKLDTVIRILVDRKWTVKDLALAILRYSNNVLQGKGTRDNLFQELICA